MGEQNPHSGHGHLETHLCQQLLETAVAQDRFPEKTEATATVVGGFNQPNLKTYGSNGIISPQGSGVNIKTCLSCHHRSSWFIQVFIASKNSALHPQMLLLRVLKRTNISTFQVEISNERTHGKILMEKFQVDILMENMGKLVRNLNFQKQKDAVLGIFWGGLPSGKLT